MLNNFDIRPHDSKGYAFIASAPRSGTEYIAKVFQAIGVDIQHEKFGSQGISAFYIVPHLSQCKHGLILHQTRDLLKTISSMQTIRRWRPIIEYTGIRPGEGRFYAAMRLYQHLNTEIEKYEHFRYKVEDIDSVWLQLLSILSIPELALPDIPRNTHSRANKYKPLAWYELEYRDKELTKYIKDIGYKYGYEIE